MINLLVISNKLYQRDFRKYLMRAAEKAGGKALHIRYDDAVTLSHTECDQKTLTQWSDAELCQTIVDKMGPGLCLVMMGYGDRKIGFLKLLKQKMPHAFFIYDIYDDFRYGAKGMALLKVKWSEYQHNKIANLSVVLEDGMRRHFPKAKFLLNASHMPKLPESKRQAPNKLVYIGSLDERIDFDWLDELTAQDVSLDIYGYVNVFTKEMEERIEDLLHRRANVTYHGPYDNDDLPNILAKYTIGIVPYHAKAPSTRHINPDKICHYLNAGMEVIATPFPQSLRMVKYLHLMRSPAKEWGTVFEKAQTKPRNPLWPREVCSWERRWTDLATAIFNAIRENPKTASRYLRELSVGELSPEAQSQSHDDFLNQDGPKLLHLGCGSNLHRGWHNTDLCEHTIEHVSKIDAYKMLAETLRCLKPQGLCRIVTPSLAKVAAMALNPESKETLHYLKWFRGFSNNASATVSDAVNAMFYNHGHRHIYSVEELSSILLELGYVNLKVLETGAYAHSVFDGLDSHGKVIGQDITEMESFAIEAEKPALR